jgi:hypothetical protein
VLVEMVGSSMAELTLAQLRELALAEVRAEAAKPESPTVEPIRDAKGRFAANQQDHFDLPDDDAGEVAQPPARYEKVITNDDGSRDVYRANDLQSLVDQIAAGKKAAVRQMKLVQAEKRELERKLGQADEDSRFILEQRLKDNPRDALLKAVDQTLEERDRRAAQEAERIQASADQQRTWVAAHPEYVVCKTNADRLVETVKTLGYQDISYQSLEAAFQALTAQGKLELKQPEPPTPVSTGRRSSTISARHRGAAPSARNTGFDEPAAYSMSMDELKRRANAALRGDE